MEKWGMGWMGGRLGHPYKDASCNVPSTPAENHSPGLVRGRGTALPLGLLSLVGQWGVSFPGLGPGSPVIMLAPGGARWGC